MKIEYKLLSLILVSTFAFAGVKPNCTIAIQSKKKNGEKLNIVFHTKLKDQNECRTLATLHQKNFTPDTIQSKKVSYAWVGSKIASKRTGMVARTARKSLRKKPVF